MTTESGVMVIPVYLARGFNSPTWGQPWGPFKDEDEAMEKIPGILEERAPHKTSAPDELLIVPATRIRIRDVPGWENVCDKPNSSQL